MLKLKITLLSLAFLLLACTILITGYLYRQATQPGGPVVDRRERAGLILVAATPERWER